MSSNSFTWVTEVGTFVQLTGLPSRPLRQSVSAGCTRRPCGGRLWLVTHSALEACTRRCAIQIDDLYLYLLRRSSSCCGCSRCSYCCSVCLFSRQSRRCRCGVRTSWRMSGTNYRLVVKRTSSSTSSRPCSFWVSSVLATGPLQTRTRTAVLMTRTSTMHPWAACCDLRLLPPFICWQVWRVCTLQKLRRA